jgi:hypothetical protein
LHPARELGVTAPGLVSLPSQQHGDILKRGHRPD